MQKKWDTILDRQGRPVEGATVQVNLYPGGGAATIYSDDSGTQKANPLVTDEDGYFEYYAANGHYTWIPTTNEGVQPAKNDILHDDSLTSNQQFIVATGTGDAMVVAAFATGYTLADGDEIRVRAPGANTVTNPTISLPGVGVLTIFRQGGAALVAGDVVGAGHELLLRYRAAPARVELVADAGTIDASRVIVLQSGTGAGPRTMQAKARDLPSVLDFYANGVAGAMVDPTGVVDSTTGLQNAITASAGNVLLWPGQLAGGYLISSALTIAKPLRIIAANGLTDTGNYGARLFTNTAGINLINLAQEATGGNHGFGGSIEGLMLDGNSKAAICLNITGVSTVKWAFHHMNILKATHLGTYILANHTFQFHGCQWALNGITSNLATDGGVQLGGGNEVHFYGCGLEANYGSGMLVSDGYGNGWHGGAIEGNQYHGVIGSSTGQHFTLENAVFEANNEVVAANTFDVDISATTAAHWCLQNLKFSGTNVTNSIRTKGTHTVIRNVRNVSAANKCVLWTSDATKGLMEFDIGAELDPASVINNTVNVACTKVIDTAPQGFSVTTPAVPASTVEQVNTTFVPVDIFITAVGTTTNWSVIDHGGTAQAMGAAVNAGFLCQLPPGHGIKITYSSVPSWKWYGR
jgi:hypothetical protein